MDCAEVLRLLDEREMACGEELERLMVEIARITELVRARELDLEDVRTARRVVSGLPMVGGVPGPAALVAGDEAEEFAGRVLAVLTGHGRPMRCRELTEALGWDAGAARNVERVRHRMRRLVGTGRAVEVEPGAFALPGAPDAAIG